MRLVVVGGGVVGTMHAFFARRAGFDVVQLEQDRAARSASVRNFGLVWVSGRADGEELNAALRARQLWEEIGALVPQVGFRSHGSLTVALTEAEAVVMKAFAASQTAAERGTTFVDGPRDVNPGVGGDVHGALWCDRDAIVEPRRATHAIQDWLSAQGGYQLRTGRRVIETGTGSVLDHTGERHEADVIVVCRGADAATAGPLRRVRLQMMQTEPYPDRLTTSIADADSLRYYPAYKDADLDGLGPQHPVAADNHMQLLLVQRQDGGLTIGDTHTYDEPFDFDVDEAPYLYLRERAEAILGRALPPVKRRWAGVYSQCLDGRLCWRAETSDRVWVVTGLGGRGMTCSPAVAEHTIQGLQP
jgi:FAD dependent oxidoreductase TIGR03364